MKRLPRSIYALIIYLAVLFNLERVTLQDIHIIDIKGFVYVFIVVMILLIISLSFLRRARFLALIIGSTILYTIGKFGPYKAWTTWDEYSIYLIITELSLLFIGLILALEVGRNIEDFNDAVESITFNGMERARLLSEARVEIDKEVFRSRRYHRPLTMLMVRPESDPIEVILQSAIEEVHRSMVGRHLAVNLARSINNVLRMTDMVIDLEDNRRFAILLPETSSEHSDLLIERIQRIAGEKGISVTCGKASFPDDALTLDDLIKQADKSLSFSFTPKMAVPSSPDRRAKDKPNGKEK